MITIILFVIKLFIFNYENFNYYTIKQIKELYYTIKKKLYKNKETLESILDNL